MLPFSILLFQLERHYSRSSGNELPQFLFILEAWLFLYVWRIVLLDIVFLVEFFFSFSSLNILSPCLLAWKVSADKSTDNFTVSLLHDKLLSFAAFKIVSLSLTFDSLVIVCLIVGLWVFFNIFFCCCSYLLMMNSFNFYICEIFFLHFQKVFLVSV